MASTLPSANSCCDPCGDIDIEIISAVGMLSGQGSPQGVVTGTLSGQLYTDLAIGAFYQFVGTANTKVNWTGAAIGNVLAFGADPTGAATSDTAFTNAFAALSALARPIIIPPGLYRFTPGYTLSFGNVPYVTAYGATLRNLKVTITGTNQGLIGGIFTTDNIGVNGNEVIHISGTNIYVTDVTVDYSNQTGGVAIEAWCAIEIGGAANRVRISNFDFNVNARAGIIILRGLYISITNGRIKSVDDGIGVKAAGGITKAVTISNVTAQGGANIVALGTEVGTLTDVTITNCVAVECQTAIWIKPGRADYPNAVLENVAISNITCQDALGLRYQRAIYITGHENAIIRNVVIEGVTVNARCLSNALTRAYVHYYLPDPITIKDVSISHCRFRDAEAAADPGANGFPVLFGLFIENVGASTLENILFDDIVVDGTGGAAYVDDPGAGATINNIRLHRLRCRNNVTATGSAVILAQIANLYIDDNLVIETALALPIQATAGLSIRSQRVCMHLKDAMPAGTSFASIPAHVFERKSWVSRLHLVGSSSVATDATNYTTFTAVNATTSAGMSLITTNSVGGVALVPSVPQTFEANVLAVAASIQDAGSLLRLSKIESGSGATVNDVTLIIDFVPFGTT